MKIKNTQARIHCLGPLELGGEGINIKPDETSRELTKAEELAYTSGPASEALFAAGKLVRVTASVATPPPAGAPVPPVVVPPVVVPDPKPAASGMSDAEIAALLNVK